MSNKLKDLSGQQFGKLTIIERHTNKGRAVRWKALCECGNISYPNTSNLIRGRAKTCGCLYKIRGKNNPRWTGYEEISGRYWYKIRDGARTRNLEFNITIEDIWNLFIKQDRKCALTGIEIDVINCGHRNSMKCTASLDRIDPNKGYVIDNVWWVHKKINQIKMDINKDEFIYLCHLISANNPINTSEAVEIEKLIDWESLRKLRKK